MLLDEPQRALEVLPLIKDSPRLRPDPYMRDYHCWRELEDDPVYLDVVKDQDDRRAALRERLPATLTELGVRL